MRIRKTVIILLSVLFLTGTAHSQLYSNLREVFAEAESFFLFEEYDDALFLYRKLLADNPDNHYVIYRIGLCYLNMPGQKKRALEYLEKAAGNIDFSRFSFRPGYRTVKAPPDAIFYLGKAYHVNYLFEEALETYQWFLDVMDERVYDPEVVKEHILASENAIKSTNYPVFFNKVRLDEQINTRFSETNPVVSGDESVLIFIRELPFYNAIFMSRHENGKWGVPVEITTDLGCEGDCFPTALSHDADEIYLYKTDDYIGNIYVSRYENGEWGTAEKLNNNINTEYWESHASITKDGKTLYFTSNRPGGHGGLDIYKSHKNEKGDWGPAINLGKPVNTPYNEETPFITEDGSTLYFSSHGHFNIGGYNIFYSVKMDDGEWSVPLSAGYGINTPEDDLFFHPVKNGRYAYMSRVNYEFEDTPLDIFRYEIFSDTHPRKFSLSGIMSLTEGLSVSSMARVHIIDAVTGDTIVSTSPRATGEWETKVEAGEYLIAYEERDHRSLTRRVSLKDDQEKSEIRLEAFLEPEYRLPGEITELSDDPGIPFDIDLPEESAVRQRHIPEPVPAEPGKKAADTIPPDTVKTEDPPFCRPYEEEAEYSPGEITEDTEEVSRPVRERNYIFFLLLLIVLIAAFVAKTRFYRSRKNDNEQG